MFRSWIHLQGGAIGKEKAYILGNVLMEYTCFRFYFKIGNMQNDIKQTSGPFESDLQSHVRK